MFCQHCHTALPPGAAFCQGCGAPVAPYPYAPYPAAPVYPAAYYPAPVRPYHPPKPPARRLPLNGRERAMCIVGIAVSAVFLILAYVYMLALQVDTMGQYASSFRASSQARSTLLFFGLLAFQCAVAAAALGLSGFIVGLTGRKGGKMARAAAIVQTVGAALLALGLLVSFDALAVRGTGQMAFSIIELVRTVGYCVCLWICAPQLIARFAPLDAARQALYPPVAAYGTHPAWAPAPPPPPPAPAPGFVPEEEAPAAPVPQDLPDAPEEDAEKTTHKNHL